MPPYGWGIKNKEGDFPMSKFLKGWKMKYQLRNSLIALFTRIVGFYHRFIWSECPFTMTLKRINL